jgi:hypothetical protein
MKTCSTVYACGFVLLLAGDAFAQQKQKYSFKAPAGVTSYTQQHAIEVGDVPGHVLRLAELHSKYGAEAPVYDGVKVVESWSRLTSDLTGGTGHNSGYVVNLMANGDKIFARTHSVSQVVVAPDGSRSGGYMTVFTLVGGTGKFVGIKGTLRQSGTSTPTGLGDVQTEGEYWIEK